MLSATAAWQYSAARVDRVAPEVLSAARSIKIAVIDSGADVHAPALSGDIAGTYDVRTGNRAVADPIGHGTFTASLVAGTVAGGAIDSRASTQLLIVKALRATGFTDLDVAAGILYAVKHGAQIINLSIAGPTQSPVEQSAIRYAARHGALLVAAAGNDALGGNPVEYPAAIVQPLGSDGVGGVGLVVGASDALGARAPFSESGSFISLAAPGVSVLGAVASSAQGGLYGVASGTSFAAPQVAGAAALVWGANPGLTAKQVADFLKQTASGNGTWTPGLGFGVVDVAAAVERASSARSA
jgi:subtilisin family serine protease